MSQDEGSEQAARQRVLDALYEDTPPWDIGRPQGEIVRLFEQGAIRGRVLDVGCGTGENALYLSEQGLEVWGVDGSALAIEKARAKAAGRGLHAQFVVGNALELERMEERFDTALDAGMFHSFSDGERPRYARGLASVLRPGGTFYLLCWSEHEPGTWGLRRVTQAEIRETFDRTWRAVACRPGWQPSSARFRSNPHASFVSLLPFQGNRILTGSRLKSPLEGLQPGVHLRGRKKSAQGFAPTQVDAWPEAL